jgi:hypothetical protein
MNSLKITFASFAMQGCEFNSGTPDTGVDYTVKPGVPAP